MECQVGLKVGPSKIRPPSLWEIEIRKNTRKNTPKTRDVVKSTMSRNLPISMLCTNKVYQSIICHQSFGIQIILFTVM